MKLDIPGIGKLELEHLVTDFTGTLSVDGRLLPGVRELLGEVAGFLKIHVLTSDTFGTAMGELAGIDCTITILDGSGHDVQKENFVITLGKDKVVALGNGRNDALMLTAAMLGISVSEAEGCSTAAIISSDVMVNSAIEAFGLLTNPKRLKASLRF
jgi:soluble P-type ATPase